MSEVREWSTSLIDWEKRIVNGDSIVPCGALFPEEAEAALVIMKLLKLVDVPGMPTIGESCADWIFDFSTAFFGSYDCETGKRLIQDFFILVSKKNSKSTTAAAIMLTVLIRNWRHSAEFLILAPTVEIANNSFKPARDMVKNDPELDALMLVQDHIRTITHRRSGATLKVVAADTSTVGGKKATGILIDELWIFGKDPNADNMIREATGGLASRPEGFVINLSTQSDHPPAGVFKEKLQYARDVRDGIIQDKGFLPVLYEFPKKMLEAKENREVENFYITNPNLGFSVSKSYLAREYMKADRTGEATLVSFLAKHTNMEVGMGLRSDRWAGADFWEKCAIPRMTLEELLKRSEVVTVGVDGGGLDDLLALGVLGRCAETKKWLFWAKAWAHPSVLDRRKSEASRFLDFAKDGDLVIVERMGDDVYEIVELIKKVYDANLLDKVGLDPAGIGSIIEELDNQGIPEDLVVGVSQGWRLGGAIKTAERKLAEEALLHGSQPLMDWSVSNAKIEPRANSIMITKQVSGSAKIDNVMALLNCVFLMALNPEAKGKKFATFFI